MNLSSLLGPNAADIIHALDAAGLAIVPATQTRRQEGARIMAMSRAKPRSVEESAVQYAAQIEAERVRA